MQTISDIAGFEIKAPLLTAGAPAIKEADENKEEDGEDDESGEDEESEEEGKSGNAMSVDGDISYNSVEMKEVTEVMQPLKFKEANSSLHLVEK